MTRIKEVNLQGSHEAGWTFPYRGPALPRDLRVTDGSQWWTFECESKRDNEFCIKGSAWIGFVGPRVNDMVTLYKEDDEDFYRIRVKKIAG